MKRDSSEDCEDIKGLEDCCLNFSKVLLIFRFLVNSYPKSENSSEESGLGGGAFWMVLDFLTLLGPGDV